MESPVFASTAAGYGRPCVVYQNPTALACVTPEAGKTLQNKLGVFPHSSLAGSVYGEKVWDSKQQKYIYLLPPTPELWTRTLATRTQIVFRPDISFVLAYLDVRPGTVVIESGTGSASMTVSLCRSVAPTGRVFTYEFNEVRATSARLEFEQLGLNQWITSEYRDVIAEGFAHSDMKQLADGIFLDLPSPWEVVRHLPAALKVGGRLCSFSPCIEQVQRMCEQLRSQGFSEVETYETLASPMVSKRCQVPTLTGPAVESVCLYGPMGITRSHTGYLTCAIRTD